MLVWVMAEGLVPSDLGYLPGMLSDEDPRPAREQLDANYVHGGGGYWRTEPASIDANDRLCYPGDPPQSPLAFTMLREETILLYPGDFVVILQEDGSFVFQRMD